LVCTAGVCEDGSWIRLYPLPFRKLDDEQKYKKWQWIEVDVERNISDIRPESFRVFIGNLTIIQNITEKVNWNERKRVIFKTDKVFTNKAEILKLTKSSPPSRTLLTFKPTQVVRFYTKEVEREWPKDKVELIKEKAKQLSLFQTQDDLLNEFKVVDKLPYEFRYIFTDDEGVESDLMIEDWEVGALYLNCLRNANGDEKIAIEKVTQKYWNDFAQTKDIHFFLGTRKRDQVRSPNPFGIVGVIPFPVDKQEELF
jgi:hypothetical protein